MKHILMLFFIFFAFSAMGLGEDFSLKDIKTGWFTAPNLYFDVGRVKKVLGSIDAEEISRTGTCLVSADDQMLRQSYIIGWRKVEEIQCASTEHTFRLLMMSSSWLEGDIRFECFVPKSRAESCGEIKVSQLNTLIQIQSAPFDSFLLFVEK